MASELSLRRQESAKRTASLGSALNQGGDSHRSSSDDLAGILGQGKSKKSKPQLGFGKILGQGGK